MIGQGHSKIQENLERIAFAQLLHHLWRSERAKQFGVRTRGFASFTQRDLMIVVNKEKEDERGAGLGMSMFFEQCAVALHSGFHFRMRTAEPGHDEGVIASGRSSLERLQTQSATVDRWVRLLQRLRGKRQRRNLPEFPFVRERVLSPRPPDDFEGLFVARPALVRVDTETLEVFGDNPAPDAEVEAPAAENIEHGKVLGFAQRVFERQEANGRA